MAKTIIILVSAICILALATVAQSHPSNVFSIAGKVYCDPCRLQFETEFSRPLPGAIVKLECLNIATKKSTYSVEGVADRNGYYNLRVEGDHQEDICEVKVVKSPKPECNEIMTDVESSRIELTKNSGIVTDIRYANPIGLMTKEALPQCSEIELFLQYDQN